MFVSLYSLAAMLIEARLIKETKWGKAMSFKVVCVSRTVAFPESEADYQAIGAEFGGATIYPYQW